MPAGQLLVPHTDLSAPPTLCEADHLRCMFFPWGWPSSSCSIPVWQVYSYSSFQMPFISGFLACHNRMPHPADLNHRDSLFLSWGDQNYKIKVPKGLGTDESCLPGIQMAIFSQRPCLLHIFVPLSTSKFLGLIELGCLCYHLNDYLLKDPISRYIRNGD